MLSPLRPFKWFPRWLRRRLLALIGRVRPARPLTTHHSPDDDEVIQQIRAVPCHFAGVGFGTKLEYKDGAGAWTELSDVLDIESPELTIAMAKYKPIKATHRYARRLPASGEMGDMVFTIVWTNAVQTTLLAFAGQTDIQWRITHSDTTSTETFAGHLAKVGRKYQIDEVDVIDIGIAVDGDITFA